MLVIGICVTLLAAGWAIVTTVSWIGGTRAAQATADVVALAGASALMEGLDGCAAARDAASRNTARVVDCQVFGSPPHVVVEVTVEQELRPALPGLRLTARRDATAGSP